MLGLKLATGMGMMVLTRSLVVTIFTTRLSKPFRDLPGRRSILRKMIKCYLKPGGVIWGIAFTSSFQV
jgi:hypothetical protein